MSRSIQIIVRIIALAFCLSLFVTQSALAQGSSFTYQGALNNNNLPGNGSFDFEFKLFDSLAGGTQQGGAVQRLNVPVSNGIFTVTLDFGAAVFTGAARFLEISVRSAGVGVFTLLTPRQQVTATPYAIKAANAGTADSLSATCVGCVTSTQIQGGGAYINNTTTQQAGANFNIGGNGTVGGNLIANGNVGIGTSTPGFKLHTQGSAPAPLIYGQNDSADPSAVGVAGSSNNGIAIYGTTLGGKGVVGRDFGNGGYGVEGKSVTGYGVVGESASAGVVGKSTGSGPGVYGESALFNGVRGVANNSDHPAVVGVHNGVGIGVYGESPGTGVVGISTGNASGIGVYGESAQYNGVRGVAHNTAHGAVVGVHTSTGIGVYGTSNYQAIRGDSTGTGGNSAGIYGGASGNNANGVVGEANTGPSAYGVWGKSTSGYAGTFSGNVQVTGTLSKGGGAFKIDHPLDPANKYLYHSFVESPDMMNIYNGNVTTDERGEALVTLPDYFTALNRDFRYQLTVLGQFAQAMIAEKIKENSFKIRTSLPNVEVSWQVTGIRQDAWANAHRIKTEEDKPQSERGYYLYPKLFNQPEEKSVEWARHPEMMKQQKEKQ